MIKEYCDICGKETVTDKYFLPVIKDSYVRDRHGTPMVATKVISSERKDVCKKCARKICFLIDRVLPMFDKDISITFESSEVGKSYRIEYIGDKL
ncbi:MAG: hypothetical protein ACLRMG_01030 [Clostridium sp.]|jgi:hypothetical protein|nr:MAG TPA: hypothetical protein [Bacteriophage sp.]